MFRPPYLLDLLIAPTLNLNGKSVKENGLVDSGATVNVLPYSIGAKLGEKWDDNKAIIRLSGSIYEMNYCKYWNFFWIKRTHFNVKKIFAFVIMFVSWLVLINESYGEILFVHNPEEKLCDYGLVKKSLEKYLSLNGLYSEVYIFGNTKDFETSISRLSPDIAFITSYYYFSKQNDFKWKSILKGHYKNKNQFNKILVCSKNIKSPHDLAYKSLATTSYCLSFLKSQFNEDVNIINIRAVKVSKDIDAIMALGFGQVEAAIVTQTSFNRLKKINPEIVKNLNVLIKLKPILYPKVALFHNLKSANKYKKTIANMPYSGSTKKVLKYFGITGFIDEE